MIKSSDKKLIEFLKAKHLMYQNRFLTSSIKLSGPNNQKKTYPSISYESVS